MIAVRCGYCLLRPYFEAGVDKALVVINGGRLWLLVMVADSDCW